MKRQFTRGTLCAAGFLAGALFMGIVQQTYSQTTALNPQANSQGGAAAGQSSAAASGTAATQARIYFCTNQVVLDQQNRKYKEFWSDAFASDAEQADLSSAWRVYLTATYQLNPNDGRQINGGCGDKTTVQITREWKANAKQSWERTTKIEQDRVAAGSPGIVEEHTVVETGWKYTPNPNAAAPAATASNPADPCVVTGVGLATYASAAAAGCGPPRRAVSPTPPAAPVAAGIPAATSAPVAPRRNVPAAPVAAAPIVPAPQTMPYAVCWSESPARHAAYFGVPFPVAKAENQAWAKEFRDFLTMKYGRVGLISCRTLKSLPEAQQQTQTWMGAARAKDTLVETGWKFQ